MNTPTLPRKPKLFALLCAISALVFTGCSPNQEIAIVELEPGGPAPETITTDFPNADVREMLKALGQLFHLKLDLPADLNGRTSIKLRDVTWRQIFAVTLSPIGYDFYEENGTVVIRTTEEIAALPPVAKNTSLQHVSAHDAVIYLNRVYRGRVAFTQVKDGIAYQVSRSLQQAVQDEIQRIDTPEKTLVIFPQIPHFPNPLPIITPALQSESQRNANADSDKFTTHIFLVTHVDAELVKPYLEQSLASDKGSKVIFDARTNVLVVTAFESRMPQLEAIVSYLDDTRWYEPETSPADH